ncbi:galactose mutarotase [Flavobacteriaceae bacterium TP-CH-4]|uniref:Galactose mutarotase n=1 Tax=Pelagihabitans pacificus TaxID=2696054 RepID=A0A967AQU2_9FLAO|nr:aldose epimerase family protein [Pelagihabitans pacificus]NHF57830.1 galactose mutarotase [Pelagihabitans pacificus]
MKQVTISNPFITLIVLDYGAIIQKLLIKDAKGNTVNAVIGFDYPDKYLNDQVFLGACVGRFAGRISKGTFELDRETFLLYQENGVHLHGGKEGFGKKYWTFEEVDYGDTPFVRLSYWSKHLEEGYPGNLKVSVTYRLENNKLLITHKAVTDRTTVVNLTNHSYFRLDDASSVNNYELQLNCSRYLVLDEQRLPTGEIAEVADTPYDFRNGSTIGNTRLDTPVIIDDNEKVAAKLHSKRSGISMEVLTDQPAMVVYTPPNMPAICFETQNYPDAPNFPEFPSCILRPGEIYKNKSQFIFDIE